MNSADDTLLKSLAVKYGYSGLFYSPKNMTEIYDWIDAHSASERSHLYTVLGMTCNLYSGLLAEMIVNASKEEE